MSVTDELASYIVSALHTPLPGPTATKTSHHLLDTIAACASGAQLGAGKAGHDFVVSEPARWPGPAVPILGTASTAGPAGAALANAMAGHADETDDSNEFSRTHPGCSIVPAALSGAVTVGASAEQLLRAVALGYDVAARLNIALWPRFQDLRETKRSTHNTGGMFGSAVALAALHGLDHEHVKFTLSYVAQQVAGTTTWKRDVEHIEKSYVFAGWPALGAFHALEYVTFGWPGVRDVFDEEPNFLEIVGVNPDPQELTRELGERYEVDRTNIKRFSVGSPAQAPLQGIVDQLRQHQLSSTDVERVVITMPTLLTHTVQGARQMPDINLPYLAGVATEDGDVSFEAAHDEERFQAWQRDGGRAVIEIVPDPDMEPRRQAIVALHTAQCTVSDHVTKVRGSYSNPMTTDEVREKAIGLLAPVVGDRAAAGTADAALGLVDGGSLDGFLAALADVEEVSA